MFQALFLVGLGTVLLGGYWLLEPVFHWVASVLDPGYHPDNWGR